LKKKKSTIHSSKYLGCMGNVTPLTGQNSYLEKRVNIWVVSPGLEQRCSPGAGLGTGHPGLGPRQLVIRA
jgi:hypothetical protein